MTVLFDGLSATCMEIDATVQSQLWQECEVRYSTPGFRWQAYLNQLGLQGMLPWLQEEFRIEIERLVIDSCEMEGVNGIAITVESLRFILIPSEDIDRDEMRVPQEWVDLPRWMGDYYFPIHVNPDDGVVEILGYTTHALIKQQGQYDESDRTYSLDSDDLVTELAVFTVTRELCVDELTRSSVATLPSLSTAQANELIQQLGDAAVMVPRLAVPFEQWGALLEQDEWRSRLFQHRLSPRPMPASGSAPVSAPVSEAVSVPASTPGPTINLRQWLEPLRAGEQLAQNWLDQGWQLLDALMPSSPEVAMAFRRTVTSAADSDGESKGKRLVLTVAGESIFLLLLVKVIAETDGRFSIRVQLRPDSQANPVSDAQPSIPPDIPPEAQADHPDRESLTMPDGVELALIAPSGDVVQRVQGRSLDTYIQLKRFRLPPDTPFSLRIQLGDCGVTEWFTT